MKSKGLEGKTMAPFKILVLFLVGGIVSAGPAPSRAEAIVGPGGPFASMQDYLAGSWAATRPATHVGWRVQFTRGGEFAFRTKEFIAYGRYEARPNAIRMLIHRACAADGGNCRDRSPPADNTYPLRLLNANEYESANEHWRRISRE